MRVGHGPTDGGVDKVSNEDRRGREEDERRRGGGGGGVDKLEQKIRSVVVTATKKERSRDTKPK